MVSGFWRLWVVASVGILLFGCDGGFRLDGVPELVVDSTLSNARVGTAYNDQIVVSGGMSPYTFVDYSGLPAGMAFDETTGAITGTPLEGGTIQFYFKVQDAANQTVERTVTMIIKPLGVSIVTDTLPAGNYLVRYDQTLSAINGTPPYIWSVGPAVGALPQGLRLNSDTGKISGTPDAKGTATFTITVTDSDSPATSFSKEYTIEIQ